MARDRAVLAAIVTLISIWFTNVAISANESNSSAEQPSTVELALWEYAVSTGQLEEVTRFLDLYPNSVFTDAALELQAALSGATESTSPPVTGTAPPTNAGATSPETPDTKTSQATDAEPIRFDAPLSSDVSVDGPRSIQQLAKGSPVFPPIDGLPAEYWEAKDCSNCHEWKKENLCVQGEFFAKHDTATAERIKHPYGGFFKKALKEWAANGCL